MQVAELELNHNQESQDNYYFQIDVLKTIMIFLVIYDHTIPWAIKDNLGVALWERISIPVFMVIMGFNLGKSLQKKKLDYGESYYSRNYFWKKFYRFANPFIILYIISTIVGFFIYGSDLELVMIGQWLNPDPLYMRYDERHLLIGILPFWGPGNWFIPVIFGGVLILPWIYKGFSGSIAKAILTLILCFVIELAAQFIIFQAFKNQNPPPTFISLDAYYNTIVILYSIFVLMSAVGFGMWFSRDHGLFSVKNLFIWILFPLSLFYLINYQFFNFRLLVDGIPFLTGDYNFMVFPYSAFLFLVFMQFLPKKSMSKYTKVFKIISKSTYHILLTQILYFGIVYAIYGDHYSASIIGINQTEDAMAFLYLLINWLICIPSGVFWWYSEKKIGNFIRNYF